MVGICYFPNKYNKFLLEEQIKSIVESTEDKLVLFKAPKFTPEVGDQLVERALKYHCDKIQFVVNEDMSYSLEKALKQEYGKFIETEVIIENCPDFLKLYENDINQNSQNTQAISQGQNIIPQNTIPKTFHVFYCDSILPDKDASIDKWYATAYNYYKSNIIKNDANLAKTNIFNITFTHMPNAQVMPSVAATLWKKFSNALLGNREFEFFKENGPYNKKFIEMGSNVQDVIKAISVNEQSKLGNKYILYLPKWVCSPFSYNNVSVVNSPIASMANKNNEKILEMLKTFLSGNYKEKELSQEEIDKYSEDKFLDNKIEYICTLAEGYNFYKKTNGNSDLKTTEEKESEFDKAMKEFLKNLTGIPQLLDMYKSNSKEFANIASSVESLWKAHKQDKEREKRNSSRNEINKEMKKEKKNIKKGELSKDALLSWEDFDKFWELIAS